MPKINSLKPLLNYFLQTRFTSHATFLHFIEEVTEYYVAKFQLPPDTVFHLTDELKELAYKESGLLRSYRETTNPEERRDNDSQLKTLEKERRLSHPSVVIILLVKN